VKGHIIARTTYVELRDPVAKCLEESCGWVCPIRLAAVQVRCVLPEYDLHDMVRQEPLQPSERLRFMAFNINCQREGQGCDKGR
jgi:hypothetical protein